jgi:misacylated tRNA(Ala) deacylase
VKEYADLRMHSAEHILNQTMVRMFNCDRCFRAHIEKKKSKCDYHFDRPLTDEEIDSIQSKVNQVIESDLPVREEFLGREEARAEYNLERLPEETGNRIRIIRVGDYDACPCIGPHVSSTREIGGFRILSSSFEDGVLRIRFKLESKERTSLQGA